MKGKAVEMEGKADLERWGRKGSVIAKYFNRLELLSIPSVQYCYHCPLKF